jgi:hypothetical protein
LPGLFLEASENVTPVGEEAGQVSGRGFPSTGIMNHGTWFPADDSLVEAYLYPSEADSKNHFEE